MDYRFYPPVKKTEYTKELCSLALLKNPVVKGKIPPHFFKGLPEQFQPQSEGEDAGFVYSIGLPVEFSENIAPQGYLLAVTPTGITVKAEDLAGLRYGLDTLRQLVGQAENGGLTCLRLADHPALENRGLMLDVSRGKVYTREYLLGLADLLGRMRYNVLQLYVEHTFAFAGHPEISEGSDPVTAGDILALQDRCKYWGIELQANLQSLGHCNRLLTREKHRHLAESQMYWSLATTSEDVLTLLEELYGEYLPLFESEWLNVCMDEPYDIGKGQSARFGKNNADLYVDYLLNIHRLAARFGKKIMVFGDVIVNHPEYLAKMPGDIIYVDWCYDPKPVYGTPGLFAGHNMPFWVCPGSGSWNTLFPRLDGAVTNIVHLVTEGLGAGGQGMLFTDWNDHGAYTQPGPVYYSYAYAGAVSWQGSDPGADSVGDFVDYALDLPGYSAIVRRLGQIYQLPPLWSKNRSECVMALFDEPIFGQAVRGDAPPDNLKAYDLALPQGIEPVFERHSQHPLRPYFAIPEGVCAEISQIIQGVLPDVCKLADGTVKNQLLFVIDGFSLMVDKLAFSREIIDIFAKGQVDIGVLLTLEDRLRGLIRRFFQLQQASITNWLAVAKWSEMEISLTYYAGIIARLDYLRDWLSVEREKISKGEGVDLTFVTYQTAGYTTLPTY